MDKKKKILAIAALMLIGGIVTLSITTGNIGNLRSAYIYDGDGNIIGSDDTASTIEETYSTDVTTTQIDAAVSEEELKEYIAKSEAREEKLQGVMEEIKSHIDSYDACDIGAQPELDKYLKNMGEKTDALTLAKTELENYKNNSANGTLIGKTRVSIADQEAELATLLSQMPAGSPVTATSTAAVNNKRISTNKAIIAKTTTSAEQKSLLTTENTNITRINTLKTQLSALYKAKKYTTLLNTINAKQKELDITIDTNEPRKELEVLNTNLTNYKKNKANGVVVDTRGTRVSIATLESDFATLVSQMPAGSPVTATSTAEVDNKRISDNNGLIGAWTTTGLTKKLQDAVKVKDKAKEAELRAQIAAINEENKKITSIATLKWRLQTAYSAKAYMALVKSIDAKTAEVTVLGEYPSRQAMFQAQIKKRENVSVCKVEFLTWWKAYKRDIIQGQKVYSILPSLVPTAYAEDFWNPEEAEKARQEAEDEYNKAKKAFEDAKRKRQHAQDKINQLCDEGKLPECNISCSRDERRHFVRNISDCKYEDGVMCSTKFFDYQNNWDSNMSDWTAGIDVQSCQNFCSDKRTEMLGVARDCGILQSGAGKHMGTVEDTIIETYNYCIETCSTKFSTPESQD